VAPVSLVWRERRDGGARTAMGARAFSLSPPLSRNSDPRSPMLEAGRETRILAPFAMPGMPQTNACQARGVALVALRRPTRATRATSNLTKNTTVAWPGPAPKP
jgi:hypothetical protein